MSVKCQHENVWRLNMGLFNNECISCILPHHCLFMYFPLQCLQPFLCWHYHHIVNSIPALLAPPGLLNIMTHPVRQTFQWMLTLWNCAIHNLILNLILNDSFVFCSLCQHEYVTTFFAWLCMKPSYFIATILHASSVCRTGLNIF